jgi:carbon-monoxide dehydrogenase large subunit
MGREFKGRREDNRLVTGRGRYTADRNLPGQAYGVFVRADRAHAEIAAIDASAALAAPGVLAVLTGKDVAEAGYRGAIPVLRPPGKGGEPMKAPPRHIMAQDKVRFVGEVVALVVAETEAQAQDAAELVTVDYRDLPVATRAESAAAPGAPLSRAPSMWPR